MGRQSGLARRRTPTLLLAAGAVFFACASPNRGGVVFPAAPVATLAASAHETASSNSPQVRWLSKPDWVEVVAHVVASDDEAPAQARSRALSEARRAAVEFVAGVRVKTGLISFEQIRGEDASSLVQILSTVRTDALVVEERLVDTRSIDLPGDGYRVRIVMRARILDRSTAPDSDFRTEVKLGRARLFDGDEVALSVRSSRDARIYVLGVSEDGAALLLPNRYVPDTRVEAGDWLHFPGEALRERGVRLIARVPKGRRAAREALIVVSLRGDRRLRGLVPARGEAFRATEASGAGHLLADLLSPLADLPPDAWTFDQIAYEVRAR